jgi:hypothetical protein
MPNAPQYTYKRPWLYPKQQEAIFCDERWGLIEASTKSGKTVACMAWLMEQAVFLGGPGRNFGWMAPVTNQAKIAYRRTKEGLPPGMFESNDTNMEITIPNGAMLRYMGSDDPDNIFGHEIYAGVVDEASRVREESWHAFRTTLTATQGPARLIGNVKGRKNWFWRLCRQVEGGREGYHFARLTASDAVSAGVFNQEELEDARWQLPHNVFRELYYAEAGDDEGNPFGFDAIRACVTSGLSLKEPRVWGWDLAKSQDWSVGIALDEDWRVCRFERFQTPWLETLETIRRFRGMTPALVDSTGVGDPIVEALQRGTAGVEGFKFSLQSKQKLMLGLASVIQQGRVSFPEGQIVRELESFEYQYRRQGIRYSAPDGLLDDCVDALALAVRMAEVRRVRGPILALPGEMAQGPMKVPAAW